MPRRIDPVIADALKKYEIGSEACWDCHGTWVIYHRFVEIMAVKAGITFDAPLPLEANGLGKSVAICVTGHLGDRSDWSIGEASPSNNKNGYPYAMAEKRARDRVVLKLIGLSGFVYSEEEADEFKDRKPEAAPAPPREAQSPADGLIQHIQARPTIDALERLQSGPRYNEAFNALSAAEKQRVSKTASDHREAIKAGAPNLMAGA